MENKIPKLAYSTEGFIQKAKEIHGNKYDYSKSEYFSAKEKTIIICGRHGKFLQSPYNHLAGKGCKRCACEAINSKKKYTKESFIVKAKTIHGDRFSYDNIIYKSISEKVLITCKIHGDFLQSPRSHLQHGCPECKYDAHRIRMFRGNKFFIDKARLIHGDKFIYTEVNYTGKRCSVEIICKKHGKFSQIAENHISKGYGCGCHGCELEELELKRVQKLEKFLSDASKRHGNKYQYDKENFVGLTSKLKIICPLHSFFYQTPALHLISVKGGACPSCSIAKSGQEDWVFSYLEKNNIPFNHRFNKLIPPKEIDFYIPSSNLAIECNGLLWHSEFPHTGKGKDIYYHLDKTNKCNQKGVKLFHFIETDIKFRNKIVKSTLNRYFKINKSKINFNKSEIKEISEDIKSTFLNKYEINGDCKSNFNLGIFYKNRLVCVAAFIRYKSNTVKLVRLSEMFNFYIENALFEIEKALKTVYFCNTIQIKLNNNWPRSDIELSDYYVKRKIQPKAWYYINKQIKAIELHIEARFINKLEKQGKYNDNISVAENCVNNKWNRIWDTGSIIYEKQL